MLDDNKAVYYVQGEFDVVREVLHGSLFEKERRLEAIQCLDRMESRALMALDDLGYLDRDNKALRDIVHMYEGDPEELDEFIVEGVTDWDIGPETSEVMFIEVDLDDLMGNA